MLLYIVQVEFWIELPVQRRLGSIFVIGFWVLGLVDIVTYSKSIGDDMRMLLVITH